MTIDRLPARLLSQTIFMHIELGLTQYLVKPTLPTTLLDALQQVLGIGRI